MSESLKLRQSIVINKGIAEVFAAWSTAEAMATWFAPMAVKQPMVYMDFKVNGDYEIIMDMEQGTISTQGTYQEIIVNERIVFTWQCTAFPESETRVTVLFNEINKGTEVKVIHEKLLTKESLEGHRQGWLACFAGLKSYFEK